MSGKDFLIHISDVDIDLIEEAETSMTVSKKKNEWLKWAVAVACMCLIFGVVIAIALGNADFNPEDEKQESASIAQISKEESSVEADWDYLTFEEAIAMSDCVFIGEYTEMLDKDAYVEYKFRVLDVLGGEMDEDTVYVFSIGGNTSLSGMRYENQAVGGSYVPGAKYLLVTEKQVSIMYEHDRYIPVTEMILCLDTGEYQMHGEKVELPERREITEYASEIYASYEHRTVIKEKVSYEDELSEFVAESRYIAVVEVLRLEKDNTTANSTVFRCKPQAVLKGGKINTYGDGSILLSVEKETMQVGGQYIVGFESDNEKSLIYAQSMLGGVYPTGEELIEKISVIVETANTESGVPENRN